MAKIKYAQIGVGHAHASKMSVYRDSDDYEVVGVYEPDAILRRQAEARDPYRDLKWLTLEQLLNTPHLKVVGIETRVRDLLKYAKQCVDAGLHIHLDKPAGESFPEYKNIIAVATAKHLAVQMGYMYRYNPAVVMLRDWQQKGWLGEPFEAHTVMSKLVGTATRKSLAAYQGGSMFELGCHIIDLTVGVLGPPTAVHAFPRHSSAEQDPLLDNMLSVFEYPRATATVRSSVNEVEGFARRHFVVCGSEATFHIQPLDAPKARVALRNARGDYRKGYQEITFPRFVRYVDDAADLAKVVRGEKDAAFSYQHDLAVQRAVLESSQMKTN